MKRRIGDVELAFDDRGSGPPLVLLHPFPFDRRMFAGNVAPLVQAGHRVITVDLPGFGESSAPPALSIAGMAAAVAGLVEALELPRVALAGESMGGYVALAFAQAHGDRLQSLALCDTRAAADSDAVRAGRAQALATIAERGVDAYLDGSLPRLLAPDARPELLAVARSLAERRAPALVAGIAALRDRPDRSAELPRLRCPTLVLVGAADQVTPAAEMRALAAAIPAAHFVELAGAGHLANLEAPEPFNRALVDHLRGRA